MWTDKMKMGEEDGYHDDGGEGGGGGKDRINT